jgi:hypothetical protein
MIRYARETGILGHHVKPMKCAEQRATAPVVPLPKNGIEHRPARAGFDTATITRCSRRSGFCFGCALSPASLLQPLGRRRWITSRAHLQVARFSDSSLVV